MKKIFTVLFAFIFIHSGAQTPVKKVLMEEFTTVLCGACPPLTHTIHQFHNSRPNTILITLHEGFGRDSMSNPTTYSIFNAFKPTWGSFAPALMIDRTVYPTIDTLIPYIAVSSGYDTLVDNALMEPPFVDIQINSQYFPGIGGLYSTVTATFVDPLPAADYRINLFLVEDSVSGYGYPGYAQKCYSPQFVAQYYPGYQFANDTISGYPHRYVLRNTLTGNAFGSSQTIPVLGSGQSPVIGTPYIYTMTTPFIIPWAYNFDQLYLVASVNRFEQGSYSGNIVINAEMVKVTDNILSGIQTLNENNKVQAYPNPFSDILRIEFETDRTGVIDIILQDTEGRIVYIKGSHYDSGINKLELDPGNIDQGVYLLNLKGSSFQYHLPIMMIK